MLNNADFHAPHSMKRPSIFCTCGLGMQVGVPHEIDDELWLEGIEGFTGAQPARVKWVKNAADKELFTIGVAFEGV